MALFGYDDDEHAVAELEAISVRSDGPENKYYVGGLIKEVNNAKAVLVGTYRKTHAPSLDPSPPTVKPWGHVVAFNNTG